MKIVSPHREEASVASLKQSLQRTATANEVLDLPPKKRASQFTKMILAVLVLDLITLYGCQDLVPRDTRSLLIPSLRRSEVFGFLAGFGTTFAAMPDLIAMLRRRSSAGMHPRMAAIMGAFQILWVYYGFLIASRPVILWNVVAVLVNFLSVSSYLYFERKEKGQSKE